jgi:putative FmdB family regulatory protein
MPLYDYQCPQCGRIENVWARMDEDPMPCPRCATLMSRLVTAHYHVIPDMAPYYDDNLETHVRSRKHREQVMREKGLAEKFGKGWV